MTRKVILLLSKMTMNLMSGMSPLLYVGAIVDLAAGTSGSLVQDVQVR